MSMFDWIGTVGENIWETVGDIFEGIGGLFTDPFEGLTPDIPDMSDSPTYGADRIGNTISEGVYVSRCYGKCKIGGNKIRFNGPAQSDLRIIVGHCQGEVNGILRWEVNDIEWSELTGSHTKTEYTGTRTQTADGRFAANPSGYRGIAYTAFTFAKEDQEIGYNPNITVVMEGLKCAPLAGGVDAFTRNPAVILYDWYLNVEGYSAGDLNLPAFKSLEAYCDQIPTGGTLPRYRLDFNFDTNMTINDAKKIIWQSFNGRAIMSQGKIKPVWDASVMANGSGGLTTKTVSHAFDESNIVKDLFSWKQPERPNTVRIHFKDAGVNDIFYPTASGDDYFWSDEPAFLDAVSYMNIGNFSGILYGAGIVFKNITIPQGSTIISAHVSLRSSATYATDTCNANIYFEDADDAVAATDRTEAEALSLTDAIAWDSLEHQVSGNWYQTPNIAAGLQTIVDKAGFASGNAVQVVIKDNNSSANAFRSVATFETTTYIPRLYITWIPEGESGKNYKNTSIEIKDPHNISVNGEILHEEKAWFITDSEIAGRRVKYKFNKFKYEDYITTLSAFSDAGDLEVYDLVTVSHVLAGWNTKEFTVISKGEDHHGRPGFMLKAYYSGIYDDSAVSDQWSNPPGLPGQPKDKTVFFWDFDANSILKADTADTPVALTVAEQTLVARLTGGNIDNITETEFKDGFNVGYVPHTVPTGKTRTIRTEEQLSVFGGVLTLVGDLSLEGASEVYVFE